MKKYFSQFVLVGTLLFSIIPCAQSKKDIVPEAYVAYKTSEALTIDGKADEASWEKSKWTKNFIDIEGDKIPKYQTNVKMLWDENNVYFFAELKEPHIWGNLKKRDTIIFYNNDFEIFIDPDGDTYNYYELEFNVLNTLWDLFLTRPYREGNAVLNDWDANGIKSAVYIDGTLNNPNDVDKKWSIEIAIPLQVFKTSYFQKIDLKDHFWRINFSRVNWDFQLENGRYQRKKNADGKFAHEYNWVWSPQGVISMHQPETWGYVYFSSEEAGNNVTFTIPKDEKIKWKLYELYRAQKTYFGKNKRWASSISDLISDEINIENKTIKPTIESHSLGWNISVKSPFTSRTLIVREDGKFILK